MPAQRNKDSKPPWWSGQLSFECTACGKCCKSRGEHQFVMVNRRERQRLATFLGVNQREFNRRYTKRTDFGLTSLRFVDGACVFLKDGLCQVHDVKPTQCRSWPFWEENLLSPQTWEKDVADFCPGEGRGNVIDDDLIFKLLQETERALQDD